MFGLFVGDCRVTLEMVYFIICFLIQIIKFSSNILNILLQGFSHVFYWTKQGQGPSSAMFIGLKEVMFYPEFTGIF